MWIAEVGLRISSMKHSLIFLLGAFVLLQPASGKGKGISASPEAPVAKPHVVVSGISLSVQTVTNGAAAGASATQSGAARATVAHGSGIRIGVTNLGGAPESVTVRWFFVGKYEKSRNWFRAGDGEKSVSLDPKKAEALFGEGGTIESHVTKSGTSQYKSGGHMAGWVVSATNAKGELVGFRTSDSYLEGFVSAPPPKQR